ncbi:MAG TPA: virulence factor Mce, partial [Nocardioides sp.]
DNLDAMLETVDQRRGQLDALVVELRRWMGNLARDRSRIGGSVQNVSTLTRELADLLTRGRPLIKEDVAQLRQLTALLARKESQQVISELLDRLPEAMSDQTRVGTYGSWYSYYLCDFNAEIRLPRVPGVDAPVLDRLERQLSDLKFYSTAARCE